MKVRKVVSYTLDMSEEEARVALDALLQYTSVVGSGNPTDELYELQEIAYRMKGEITAALADTPF